MVEDLERLVDPDSRGDPEQPLRWTAKSVRKLADGVRELGHEVSHQTVARLLRSRGYSLRANAKTREGSSHPDRDLQFAHINQTASEAIAAGQTGDLGRHQEERACRGLQKPGSGAAPEWLADRAPHHDFIDKQLGKAIPYGVYDIAKDSGFVNVGIDADTAQFSVASIQAWSQQLGRERYPDASELMITADCGGSNGNRTRLWKTELERLADETGLALIVCHFPPGTSKWNTIEHRLFSFISQNWRGKPLVSHEVIVNLIGATTTRTGLEVFARLDEASYPKSIVVSDAEFAAVNLAGQAFHAEWNYTIKPRVDT